MPTATPIEPRGHAGGPHTPWIVLGLAWAAFAVLGLAWLAGRIAAVLSGHPWRTGPKLGEQFLAGLMRGAWHQLWPDVPTVLVAVTFAVLLAVAAAAVAGGWVWWQIRRPAPDDPLPALASGRDIVGLTLPATSAKATRLRAGLTGHRPDEVPAHDAGIALGTHRRHRRGRGAPLYASWEDVLLAFMAPRSGKTTALAAPALIAAPGPAIATSNKPDLWATTATVRANAGPVWLFDPQAITHQPQGCWWDPLTAVRSYEDAFRLADHFVQQIRPTAGGASEDFWVMAAHDLLTAFLLAAAVDTGSLADVQRWLSDPANPIPASVLAEHGYHAAARALRGRQAGAQETRDGVYETARTAAACLADPTIMAWVTPPSRRLPAIDLHAFPISRQTLYVLSKDGAGSAAPLVAGLTDQILREAVRAGEAHGGRLDPPLLAVLDEAANICKISDLPQLYSHLGSRGVNPLTILQSYAQGQRVWGEQGMAALWSAATIKLIGAGIDDARFAEDISRLVGEHDVPIAARTRDTSGHHSWQTSVRRQRILDVAQVRALPKGTALLLATGTPVAMLDLQPWYDTTDAPALEAAVAAATDRITTHARTAQAQRRQGRW